MIIKDYWGNEKNATTFKVEIIRGKASGENDKPVILLTGKSRYVNKHNFLDTKECLIKRDLLSFANIEEYLDLKYKLANEQEEINKKLKEFSYGNDISLLEEKKFLVDNRYAIFEDDEITS